MKTMHIFKEEKFFPSSAVIQIARYAIAHCGVKFSQFKDEHIIEQDVEHRVRNGRDPQHTVVRTLNDLKITTLPPEELSVCEDCLASASMQMLILKWTDV